MIIGTPSEWNADAAALLAQFLETGVGKLFLAQVAVQRPSLFRTASGVPSDANLFALRASEVAGYERALDTILTLASPPANAAKVIENYPPLDDEKAWEQKPEEKKTE
jgi:hypothetical protein